MEKSFVTMATCPLCQKPNGTLLLDRRLRPKFEMHTPTLEPCEDCRKKYLERGVMLVGTDGRQGKEVINLVVITDEAFGRMFTIPIPKGKVQFCDYRIIDDLQKKMSELDKK